MEVGKIELRGVSNQQDADQIVKALHDVWGVRAVEVDVHRGEVIVSYDEKSASLQDFTQAIIDTGFESREGHKK